MREIIRIAYPANNTKSQSSSPDGSLLLSVKTYVRLKWYVLPDRWSGEKSMRYVQRGIDERRIWRHYERPNLDRNLAGGGMSVVAPKNREGSDVAIFSKFHDFTRIVTQYHTRALCSGEFFGGFRQLVLQRTPLFNRRDRQDNREHRDPDRRESDPKIGILTRFVSQPSERPTYYLPCAVEESSYPTAYSFRPTSSALILWLCAAYLVAMGMCLVAHGYGTLNSDIQEVLGTLAFVVAGWLIYHGFALMVSGNWSLFASLWQLVRVAYVVVRSAAFGF
jgi:hypothetical protein